MTMTHVLSWSLSSWEDKISLTRFRKQEGKLIYSTMRIACANACSIHRCKIEMLGNFGLDFGTFLKGLWEEVTFSRKFHVYS